MTPDEVLAAFAALPLPVRMLPAASTLDDVSQRLVIRGFPIERFNGPRLREIRVVWDAEDAAEADRECLVEELGQALFEFWAPGFDREGTQGKQEFYRDRIRALLKRFDITPKEKP